MPVLNIDAAEFEKPVLELLAKLQLHDPHGLEGVKFYHDGCKLVMKSAVLENVRGMLPLLRFDFDYAEGELRFYYFGSVSPWKFHKVVYYISDHSDSSIIFSEPSKIYKVPATGFGYEKVVGGDAVQLACGSLYLWRSCLGLRKIFDKGLSKYFEKMITTSRHSWECTKIFKTGSDIVEEWKTELEQDKSGGKNLTVKLTDGVITDICR